MEIHTFYAIHWTAVGGSFLAGALLMWAFLHQGHTLKMGALQEKLELKAEDLAVQVSAVADLKSRLDVTNDALNKWEVYRAEIEVRLEEERRVSAEKAELLASAEQRLTDTFKALSADTLQASQKSFLDLAKGSFATLQQAAQGDLSLRQQAIESLVKPVAEQLKSVDEKVQLLEKARVAAYAELNEQCKQIGRSHESLRIETQSLVKALRQPKVRGQWGEMQLRRVAEFAGMIEHCDFDTQVNVKTSEASLRPDMVVRLPGGQSIVVDAKAPLEAYLDAAAAPDDLSREEALRRHAQQVRNHVKLLSGKEYFKNFEPSPEFVVMFLPGEMYFSAALESDPGLIEADPSVIIATPTTLLALLRSVHYGWRQEAIAKNAKEISALGQTLYNSLCTMGGHFQRMGSSLNAAVGNYNRCVGSLESRVFTSARRFLALGAASDSEVLEEPEISESVPRTIQREELLGDGALSETSNSSASDSAEQGRSA